MPHNDPPPSWPFSFDREALAAGLRRGRDAALLTTALVSAHNILLNYAGDLDSIFNLVDHAQPGLRARLAALLGGTR